MILCNNCHRFIEDCFTRETLGYDEAGNSIGLNAEEIDEQYNFHLQKIISMGNKRRIDAELVKFFYQMNVVYLTLKNQYDLKLNTQRFLRNNQVDPIDDIESFEKIEHVWSLLQEMEQIAFHRKNTGLTLEKIYKI